MEFTIDDRLNPAGNWTGGSSRPQFCPRRLPREQTIRFFIRRSINWLRSWRDVLVYTKYIIWIVFVFDLLKPQIFVAIGGAHAFFTFVFQIVHIDRAS